MKAKCKLKSGTRRSFVYIVFEILGKCSKYIDFFRKVLYYKTSWRKIMLFIFSATSFFVLNLSKTEYLQTTANKSAGKKFANISDLCYHI